MTEGRAAATLWPLCNRCPERAPRFRGRPFILCWRCSATVTAGAPVALGFVPPLGLPVALLAVCPLLIDGGLQALGIRTSNNPMRIASGLLAGTGLVSLMIALADLA